MDVLSSISGTSDGKRLWAVGRQGTILESGDGEHWNKRNSGTKNDLYSIFGTNDGKRLWAVGGSGTILESAFQPPAPFIREAHVVQGLAGPALELTIEKDASTLSPTYISVQGINLHDQSVPLSRLIDVINDRFGTDFNQADQLFFDQLVEAAAQDSVLQQAAQVNPEDKFALVFTSMLETLFIERMEQNEEVFARYMNDPAFQKVITSWLSDEVYRRLVGAPFPAIQTRLGPYS